MGRTRPIGIASIAAVVVLLMLPGPAGAGSVHASAANVPSASVPVPPVTGPAGSVYAHIAAIEATLRERGVPFQDIHLPNFVGARPGRSGLVAPTYDVAPAPMGISDMGLSNASGTIVPTVLNTTSVRGTAGLTNAQSVYLDGDGPDMFGVQMNAVATNVELFGQTGYEFWAQNFVSYTSGNGTLTFGDNVWNLSNPSGLISSNVFRSHGANGTLVAPIYYYATGPTFTVHYPFTVTFYLNATDVGDRPAIYFNYSLSAPTVHASGSFDHVVFNSVKLVPVLPAPVPEFQANGTGNDPFGLPNDLELVLVGDGDGDTTTFVRLNAQFTLDTWNTTSRAYAGVPSAYDAGSDTGETSDGVGVYYNTTGGGTTIPTADLVIGPSFLGGLWNLSGHPGYRTLSASVAPANAFLFVTRGTGFNTTTAQWVPTLGFTSGPEQIAFPNGGNYYFEWLLSDYRPIHRSLNPAGNASASVTATMIRSNALGIYTPLMAWGDAELLVLTSSGAGTSASPYVLESNQPHPIDAVFGAMNDYLFPVFPGVLLVDTHAYVHVTPPSLAIVYSADVAANLSNAGLPGTNHLQIEFWNVTNLTLADSPEISGWLSSDVGFSPIGAVVLWAGTGDLISGNTFYDQGISLALYGGTNNTVWGNSFLNATAPATNQSAVENSGANTTGIWESESGDLIYNNYFALPAPAFTPTIDPVSCEIVCASVVYADRWNVSYAPAATIHTFLGANLSGSIIGTTYQGGNYWSNYGTPANPLGDLPYNDGGRITFGGDYVPLVRSMAFAVDVNELGLAAGTAWGVEVAGVEYRTNQSSLALYSPNGTYNYTVLAPGNYTAPAGGNFTVNGTGTEVTILFTPLVALTFVESGVVPGWSWNVSILLVGSTVNATLNATNDTIVFEVNPGTYSWNASARGYNTSTPNGTVIVGGGSATPTTIVFVLGSELVFAEQRFPPLAVPWTVDIMGTGFSENYTSIGGFLNLSVFELPAGEYAWTVSAPDYLVTPASGSGDSSVYQRVSLTFSVLEGILMVTVNVPGAYVYIDGTVSHLADVSLQAYLAPGVHALVVEAAGYETYSTNVSVQSDATSEVSITLVPVPTSGASAGPLGIPDLGWALIGALGALAILGFALAATARRRGPPPTPVTPYSATAPSAVAAPAAAAARPPWQEDPDDRSEFPGATPPR
ncbi:MAG TPA: thermopsin family protease [Thermoplasmata archaeon]|nr:thermopsin family protease [Thermoplasmata archaeon]